MPILPLPQFEADRLADQKVYQEQLRPPKSMVVRFGLMKLIGEFPYDGDAKPGCGSKLVLRTHRGTEIGEMLTSTCPNAGCSHAVTRKDMLAYIDNSGGRDYPFFTDGRVLRVATVEDMNQQAKIDQTRPELIRRAREIVQRLGMPIKVSDAEPLLGGERLTFYFLSEDRIDFRPLVMELAELHHTRIEMRQVGARDDARLTADYEKCGQHCCCKSFLKVLKPVSMRNAKIQKATLDPLKISGRCGRLMCCLRYEEATYDELRANLPRKKSMVMTPDGPGLVLDSQILTQLVLVRLERTNEDAAYPVEKLKKFEPGAEPSGAAGPDEEEDDAGGEAGGSGGGNGGGGGPKGPPPQGRGPRPGQQQNPQQGQGGNQPSQRGGRPQGGPQQGPRQGSQGQGQRGNRPPGQGGRGGGGGGGGGGPRPQQQQQQQQQRGGGGRPEGGGGRPAQPNQPNQPSQSSPPNAEREDADRIRARKMIPPSEFRPDQPPSGPPGEGENGARG